MGFWKVKKNNPQTFAGMIVEAHKDCENTQEVKIKCIFDDCELLTDCMTRRKWLNPAPSFPPPLK